MCVASILRPRELSAVVTSLLIEDYNLAMHRGTDPIQLEPKHQRDDNNKEFLDNGHENVCHDAAAEQGERAVVQKYAERCV